MRASTPTSPQLKCCPQAVTTVVDTNPPVSTASSETPVLPKAKDASPESLYPTLMLPANISAPDSNEPSFASSITPKDSATDIVRLNKEIIDLKDKVQILLNHSIESDTRLLQFTDQVFVTNTSKSDTSTPVGQTTHAPSKDNSAVQCELPAHPIPSEDTVPTLSSENSSGQCNLPGQPSLRMDISVAENAEIINSLRTTVEVLEAENLCLKLQLKNCVCNSEQDENHSWTEVKRKRNKICVTTHNKLKPLKNNQKISNLSQSSVKTKTKPEKCAAKRNDTQKTMRSHNFNKTTTLRFSSVHIKGDSHTRHIAGLVGALVSPVTSVSGVCKPGARLLNVVSPDRSTSSPDSVPGPHCEVLIAGSNDVAVGAQHNIYRHLEEIIKARSANFELVVATLPHRYDVQDPYHPVHDETVLVNAFIEKIAAQHNIQVLSLDRMGRRYFTSHGQHLSMRGKRLLADMLVRSLSAPRRQTGPLRLTGNVPPCPPGPVTLRYDSYAEAVTGSPTSAVSPSSRKIAPSSPTRGNLSYCNPSLNPNVSSFLEGPLTVSDRS